MTKPQRIMLIDLFRKLADARQWGPVQREVERERITVELFGAKRSWSEAKNELGDREIDRLKRRLIALRRPLDVGAQVDDANAAEDGERRRLVHRIESDLLRAGWNEGYVRTLSVDQTDRADWRELPLPELTNLRDTLKRRVQVHLLSPEGKARRKERLAAKRKAKREALPKDLVPARSDFVNEPGRQDARMIDGVHVEDIPF